MTPLLDASPVTHRTTPVLMAPGAMDALRGIDDAIARAAAYSRTLELVSVRAGQVSRHGLRARDAMAVAMAVDVATWRDAPEFTPAERAALALTEVVARPSDRSRPASDHAWRDAARHFPPVALAALALNAGRVRDA